MIKKYALVFMALLCSFFYGFGQVSENFDGWNGGTGGYNNYSFNNFDINNGLRETTNARSGRAVRLKDAVSSNLEYVGTDGNGKDGGVGTIAFWYRSWNASPIAEYNVQISINNGAYTTIGSQISTTSTSYSQWTHTLNDPSDNIKVRIIRANGERLIIDDFEITDYTGAATCNIAASGLANISCNDNSTTGDASDDYITFDLNPTGSTLGTNYSVSVSSGSITPTTAAYGSATTFTLQNGSAGAGDVTVTLTDDADGACTFDQLISDPGSCLSGSCSGLLISEYVEGSSFNKYIEIYNPTGASINLANYQLANYPNGNTTPSTLTLSGSIGSYSTYVIANDQATIYTGTIDLSTNNNVMDFNGDDVIALQTSGGTNIDVIGQIGTDPGSEWGTGLTTTANHTLVRKSTVTSGDIDGANSFDPSIEWDGYSQDTISYLGSHTSDCEGPTPELQLTDTTPTDQACGFMLDAGSAETNVSTNDVSFYITNVGSADLEITDLTLPAGDYSIIVPATLPTVGAPLVLASSGSQLVTVRFAPTVDGTITNTLTITSNDNNEGTCTVNLTGEGFTPAPNIVVRGLVGSNPTIANGSGMGSVTFLNNTEFSAQTINVGSQTKDFRIDNTTGTAPLAVSSITLIGDTADFYVTANLASPIAAGGSLDFTMTFAPTTASGDRFAQVTVASSDPNKPTYTFYIKGTANCPSVTGTVSPTEGPIGTEVTITSSDDLTGATATLNGTPLPLVSNSSTELVVSIPVSVTIGGSISVLLSNGCVFSNPFTLIDKTISGCQAGSGTVDDLFISQVTDSPTGSLTYVELYNATGAAIDFSTTNYILKVYNNGKTTTPSNFIITINFGVVANNDTFIIAMGTSDAQCTGVTGADGSPNDLEITTIGVSINFFYKDSSNVTHLDRGHDFIGLYDTSDVEIDAFGIFGDETWATGLGLGKSGANFERKTTATIPETNFAVADWNIANWNDCSEVDYSGIGDYDYSVGLPPMSSDLTVSTGCNTATISVVGTEGYTESDDAQDLVYQWYYFNPADATLPEWKPISAGGVYTLSANGDVLSISDTSGLLDYQFYCQVRESGITCYQASNAVKIKPVTVTWNSPHWNWSDGTLQDTMPSNTSYVVLESDYNTEIGGIQTSFDACTLIVNAGNTLTIGDATYVNVVNNVLNYGTIDIQTQGSFVQEGDGAVAGTFVNSGAGIANVHKTTATFDSRVSEINYTYWSLPVNDPNNAGFGEDISTVFPTPIGNRKYFFTAQNFIDTYMETANNNDNSTLGQDDIDDDRNDWTFASGAMEVGRGYAVTTSGLPIMPGSYSDNSTVFSGALNTGDITVTLYKNNNEINDNNWNFIGNPYPSAISIDDLFSANVANGLTEAIYLWSQSQAPDANNNGNEQINFAQSDYAIINKMTQTAGSSGATPSRFIPSGQGFFVAFTENLGTAVNSVTSSDVVFTNSMRRTGSNTQFFGPNDDFNSKDTSTSYDKNILWLNLTSDNGVFSQMAFGYANGATADDDGWSYDTPRNLSTGAYAILYSLIESSNKQFAIQGKSPESLTLHEIIPIGFETSIDVATLYKFSLAQIEGSFLNGNPIYLKDKLLNKIHNLKESDYSFTSEVGEFNNRFEIVFAEDALSIDEVKVDANALQIIELQNGDVQFKISSQYEMKSIEIIDLLGRTLYKLNAEGNSQIFSLPSLSQAPYLAKVKLTNGYVITKKALKRK